jgi:4-hydroxy-tetrahydrodipicolinate reductase
MLTISGDISIVFFAIARSGGYIFLGELSMESEDNTMGIKLAVIGAGGRMGRRILSLAIESGRFEIVAAVERPDHPDIGKDSGLVAGSEPTGVELTETFPKVDIDVVIDFSLAEAMDQTIDQCLEKSIPLVSGTTALSNEQREKIKAASRKIPILHATNMSVGMNVLFSLVGKVAAMLGDTYDIEIIEQHHRFKKDAPSGSAMTLAENICQKTGRPFPESLIFGRHGKEALRKKDSIAIHAVRAGDITGVHSIIYGTTGETITLNHTANSRDTFVHGALRAAEWLVGRQTGLYSMSDVLGL